MGSELERRAREYGELMSFQQEGHRRGFIGGWRAYREALVKHFRCRVRQGYFYCSDIFAFLQAFGDEPEQTLMGDPFCLFEGISQISPSAPNGKESGYLDPHDFAWVDATGVS